MPLTKDTSEEVVRLLTVDEVAELLALPVSQVYRLQRRGDIAAVKIGRYTRFTKAQVDQFIRLNTVELL